MKYRQTLINEGYNMIQTNNTNHQVIIAPPVIYEPIIMPTDVLNLSMERTNPPTNYEYNMMPTNTFNSQMYPAPPVIHQPSIVPANVLNTAMSRSEMPVNYASSMIPTNSITLPVQGTVPIDNTMNYQNQMNNRINLHHNMFQPAVTNMGNVSAYQGASQMLNAYPTNATNFNAQMNATPNATATANTGTNSSSNIISNAISNFLPNNEEQKTFPQNAQVPHDAYFANPLHQQMKVQHPMYNPYPKIKLMPKQQTASSSLLSSFKKPDGNYDIVTVVNTCGQMVNVVNQVGSIFKGIGGIFKV